MLLNRFVRPRARAFPVQRGPFPLVKNKLPQFTDVCPLSVTFQYEFVNFQLGLIFVFQKGRCEGPINVHTLATDQRWKRVTGHRVTGSPGQRF